MAGATLVAIGTGNFINPYTPIEVIKGIDDFMTNENIKHINDIRGII